MLKRRLPPGLMPLAARLGLRPFYGDIHNHCAISYGHGSLESALHRAKQQLDFVSVTGHAHWPDMPVDDPAVAHIVDFHVRGFAKLAGAWPAHFNTLSAANEPGRFTVFPGYEIHSSAHGDRTIVYRDLDQRELVLADTPEELRQRLQLLYPGRAIAFPHHIGYRVGVRGLNWETFDAAIAPVIEIVSMHGCSESSTTDRPFLHSMGPSDGRSTVVRGLSEGHVFGFLGNTDHHSAFPGSYGHGRSCVYASENTNEALWEALQQRRTTALTGDCAHLFAAIGDSPQGSVIPPSARVSLEIEAVAGGVIDYIDVIRSGRLTHRITPQLSPAPVSSDPDAVETILVLEMGWGARGSWHDWEGTLSLSGGDVLAIEPRLRGPEIVSPLEGEEEVAEARFDWDGERLSFALRAHANPNNFTVSTQAIAMRVRLSAEAAIHANICGKTFTVPAERLFEGALSGNLGPIDSPAFRLWQLPLPHDWQWHGQIELEDLQDGEWLYLRMRQSSGQWSWASPFFIRSGSESR